MSGFTAPEMGAHVIKAALDRAGISGDTVEEAYMGNVVSAAIGQVSHYPIPIPIPDPKPIPIHNPNGNYN